MVMRIQMLWDQGAAGGIELPVCRTISKILDMPVDLHNNQVIINGYNHGRDQHHATAIIDRLHTTYIRRFDVCDPVLLVTGADLYAGGSDFVFGLARRSYGAAVVSTARLHNGYYGRPDSDDDLIDRLSKECAHEICHLMGLGHCPDPECVMFKPETLDELDRKKKMLCASCMAALDQIAGRGESAPE